MNLMTDKNSSQAKWNFWIVWTLANTVGLGFAWPLADLIGRQAADFLGWRFGQIIGIVIFEGFLWITRGAVLLRVRAYQVLKPLDILIWLSTEVMGWIVSELPVREDSLLAIAGGATFATSLGAMLWIVLLFMRIPKPRSKLWAIKAFLWTFLGFIVGSFLFSLIQTTSLVVGEMVAQLYFPILGMAIAGAILGALLGSITGFAFVRFMNWQALET